MKRWTHFRPYQTNRQLSLTAAVFLWGWECLGEFIYVATTDHYLALWKERKSIRQPHKNHLNTSRILRGWPSGKKKPKSSWHDSPFLLLPPLLIVLSFFFSVRRAPVWGHSVSARECQRGQSQLIKASLTGDSLLWRCRNFPSMPGETWDMVTLLVYLQRLQPFLLAKKKEEGKHWRGSSTESKISQDTKTGTFPHPHGTTPDLWLTQMLKLAIMQLVASPWRSRSGFHSNGGSPLKSSSGARHKERETAKEGRWGIMSSCLKWL